MASNGKVENVYLNIQWSNNNEKKIDQTTKQRGILGFNSQEIPIVDKYLTRYDVNKVEFSIRSNRCEVGTDIKFISLFWAYPIT